MDLTLDDLIKTCDVCGGSGRKPEEPGRSAGGGRSYGWTHTTITPLSGGPEECHKCAGTGRHGLTETGKALAEFIEIAPKLRARGLLS